MLCSVCTTKRDGERIPKRKCSCSSGMTQHYDRSKATPKLVLRNEGLHDVDYQPVGLCDLVSLPDCVFQPDGTVTMQDNANAAGFLAFEESLLQASEAVDVEAVAALMNGSDVPGLRRKHALSFDGVLRYAVSIACRLGSIELIDCATRVIRTHMCVHVCAHV